MENVKNLRIIAVDTSLGTNFLLSACEDATISELRGMIQQEHMSCFPEHESINVGALLVDYSEKQYHVTDHLLIGQVFSECWNKIHAVVSSGSSRAALFSNGPKPIEVESFADGKLGIPGGCLDDRPLVRSPGALQNAKSKDLSDDKQFLSDDEAPAHALVCQTNALDNCLETAPAMMVNEDCWIDREKFRCPLFSIEAPYTQPCSELNAITRAALNKGVVEYKSKRKRRKCVEQEIPVSKQKQGDEESSPDNVSSSSTKEEPQAEKHEESLESVQPDADGRDGCNGKVVLSKGDEHITNAYEEPSNNRIQHSEGEDNHMENGREQRETFLFTHTQAFVSSSGRMNLPSMIFESHLNPPTRATEEARSCGVQKNSESSSSEKEISNSTRKTEEHTSQTSDKTGTKGCPEMSAGNLQEGTEEAILNDGAQIPEMDLSRGYPIQLNDRTILLVASLSADVVPETQESQMESQDGVNPGGEGALEQAAAEPLDGCLQQERYPLVDSVEPQEMEALGLPLNQDARIMDTEELNHQVQEENLKPKPLVVADQPEESNAVTEARKLCDAHHDASCSGDSHNISIHGKRKKYRRRKVSQIDQVLMQEDGRLVGLNNEEQGVEGDVDPQKMMESLIETSNGKLETCNEANIGEGSCKLDINMGASEDVILRSRDPEPSILEMKDRKASRGGNRRKRRKRSVDSCNATGEHIAKPKKVSIEPRFRTKEGGECMEGSSIEGHNTTVQENLSEKERTGNVSDTTLWKKKKRRKELSSDHHNDARINNIHSNCEADPVYECVNNNSENDFRPSSSKELPNALGLAAIEDDELKQGEVNLDNNVGSDQVAKKKSKRKKKVNTDTDVAMCFMQEQDQNVAYVDVNDTESLSKDGIAKSSSPGSPSKESSQKSVSKDGIATSSSPGSPSKEPSQEGIIMTKQGFNVFEFEGSETVNRQKENSTHLEATSNSEADNLDKLCSVAVNFVDDEMLSPSKMTTRKASRKTVHPKRWVTVLSERLTWNQTSKSSSKRQRANRKSRRKTEVEMPSDGDFVKEAGYAEEEAKEASSQVIVDDGRIACPVGCGRLYTKKTSAYYRHCKKCSGSDS